MSLFANFENPLKSSIGNNYDNDGGDIITTKRHLKKLGYFKDDSESPIITAPLNEGIKQYQKDKQIKIDGIIKPGGETERNIFGDLAGFPAATLWDFAEDDSTKIGFGGITSGNLPARKQPKLREGALVADQKKNKTKYPDGAMILIPEPTAEKSPTDLIISGMEAAGQALNSKNAPNTRNKEKRGVFNTLEILAKASEEAERRSQPQVMSLMGKNGDNQGRSNEGAEGEVSGKSLKEDKWTYTDKVEELEFDPKGQVMKDIVMGAPRIALKARKAGVEAKSEASRKFPNHTEQGDNEVDAYRHALWSIKLTRRLGVDKAKEITDAYERERPKQSEESQLMDLENNKIAREVAFDPKNRDKSDAELADSLFDENKLIIKPQERNAPQRHDPFRGRTGLTQTQNRYNKR